MQQLLGRADGISLRDVLPRGKFWGSGDIRVHSCQRDYRAVRPGDVFVALVEAESDGHDHIMAAVERGAAAVLAERLLPVPIPCCVVSDTREAYGTVCQHLAGLPHQHLHLTGITGTFGKTITSMLMASVLKAAQRQTGVLCSLGYSDSEVAADPSHEAIQPSEIAHWLSRMALHGCTHGVVEVSSESLALRHWSGVQFDAAVLTNLRRDHLDLHGNLQNYHRAKRRLFEQLKPGGVAVINVDDTGSRQLMEQLDTPLITVGMHSAAQLQAQILEQLPSEQTFLIIAGNETVPVRTHMLGDQHVYNCLAVAALGLIMGLDLTAIVRGLEMIDHVPGRLERIECGQEFNVFVDQAHTPVTLAATLHALKQVTRGRLICLYGATGWQSCEERANLGRVAERYADIGVITSNNPGHEAPLQIAHDILDGFENPGRSHIIPDRGKAIQWALEQAAPGDTVLIAGKGEQAYQIIGDRPMPFDDRQLACKWLRGARPSLESRKSTVTLPFRLGCEWN